MRKAHNLQTGETTEHADAISSYVPPTQDEIDSDKAAKAQAIVSSPALLSAIEEFTSILQATSIPIPADVVANIEGRVKAKL